jgi:hypothetical protein
MVQTLIEYWNLTFGTYALARSVIVTTLANEAVLPPDGCASISASSLIWSRFHAFADNRGPSRLHNRYARVFRSPLHGGHFPTVAWALDVPSKHDTLTLAS